MMKPSRTRWKVLPPTLAFFLLYGALHIGLDSHLSEYSITRMAATSLAAGGVLGAVGACLAPKRREWHFWREFRVFWCWYGVVQVVSYGLIWLWFRCDAPIGGLLWTLWYWFPQAVTVTFMVPGAILYHLTSYAVYRRQRFSGARPGAD